MGFFDRFPAFLETSGTGASLNRLNHRHVAIFGRAPERFQGARVLDIASHDGRWSCAAAAAGAAHVVGVEPRDRLVNAARENVKTYGVASDLCAFVQEDAFTYLRRENQFDVVLCLGFFYHCWRQPELLALIRRANPAYIVIDTRVALGVGRFAFARPDDVSLERDAVPDLSAYKGKVWVLAPTEELLQALVRHFDFDVEMVDWRKLLQGRESADLKPYATGQRVTLHGISATRSIDAR